MVQAGDFKAESVSKGVGMEEGGTHLDSSWGGDRLA